MEAWLCSGSPRHRFPGPAVPGSSRIHIRFFLLLLLLLLLLLPRRPAACLATGEPRGTPSPATSWTSPREPCVPRATCPSGRLRLPRQLVSTTQNVLATTFGPASAATLGPASATTLGPASAATLGPASVATLGPASAATLGSVSTTKPRPSPSCGHSYEPDPTIRDPEAMTRRWPWMVSVRVNDMHICAGALIASQWVLTVAHCLTEEGKNYTVRVGSPWINQTWKMSSDVPVLQVIINSRYQAQRYWSWVGRNNDIGLLKLQWGIKFSNYVGPICLPGLDYVLEDNDQCTVMGWGYSEDHGAWPQFLTLQEKEVTILNSKECERFYHKFSKIPFLIQIITTQMICVKDPDRAKFCYEVTGEPLVCTSNNRWYLMGMMSWGPGCNHTDAPVIFLQTSSFQPWVWNTISGQPMALLVPSRTLLLALSLFAAL